MNNVYKILIFTLLLSNVFISILYFQHEKQYKSLSIYPLQNSTNQLIMLLEKPKILELQLLAESSVYFEHIGKNDNHFIDSMNQYTCTYWTKDTKEKINILFSIQDTLEDNGSLIYIKKGLDKVEKFCYENPGTAKSSKIQGQDTN